MRSAMSSGMLREPCADARTVCRPASTACCLGERAHVPMSSQRIAWASCASAYVASGSKPTCARHASVPFTVPGMAGGWRRSRRVRTRRPVGPRGHCARGCVRLAQDAVHGAGHGGKYAIRCARARRASRRLSRRCAGRGRRRRRARRGAVRAERRASRVAHGADTQRGCGVGARRGAGRRGAARGLCT